MISRCRAYFYKEEYDVKYHVEHPIVAVKPPGLSIEMLGFQKKHRRCN